MLGWINAWQYANTHPSRGVRGVLSLPRLLTLDDTHRLVQSPMFEHAAGATSPSVVPNRQDAAFDLLAEDTATITINGQAGPALVIVISRDRIRLDRRVPGHPLLDNTFEMLRWTTDPVRLIIDQGTVEIFADSGRSVMSALFFAGIDWSMAIEGACDLSTIHP